MINPEGWIGLKIPVTNQYFRLISELMGKKASMPGGRVTVGSIPFSSWFTKNANFIPISTTVARNRY
jgi:hypothetical protein